VGTKAICIDADPSDIWATLASFDSIARWAPNVNHSCLLTEQDSGVGASRRIQQGNTVVIETVTVWEPPHCLEYRIDGLPPRIGNVFNRWEVGGHDGHSDVMLTARAGEGARGPAKLAAKAVGVALGRVNATMLNGLAKQFDQQENDE
jgi:hypothetical protein